jgi:NAD+ synthase
VAEAGVHGTVFGLSGGLDSAVVAALCKKAFPDHCLGIIMPCFNSETDLEHAQLAAAEFQVPLQIVNLENTFTGLVKLLTGSQPSQEVDLSLVNIKPRLRMTVLYYYASKHNYLVAGTGNRSEISVGYFTKYGDGGVDILPLANLVKEQVRELAVYLGVPAVIIEKPPSGGLWPQQTDESELGVTYHELDTYLTTGQAVPRVKELVEMMIQRSVHKRCLPPSPEF